MQRRLDTVIVRATMLPEPEQTMVYRILNMLLRVTAQPRYHACCHGSRFLMTVGSNELNYVAEYPCCLCRPSAAMLVGS
jgi:hypothetical protein